MSTDSMSLAARFRMPAEVVNGRGMSAAATSLIGGRGTAEIADELDSRALFGPSRRLTIVHQGERYFLQVTRAGKLLLTK